MEILIQSASGALVGRYSIHTLLGGEKPVDPDRSAHESQQSAEITTESLPFTVRMGNFDQSRPVFVRSRLETTITTRDSKGLAHYAGVTTEDYFRISLAVAYLQIAVLSCNPLLLPEDLACGPHGRCLLSWQDSLPAYAPIYEQRVFCAGCQDFYHALGCDSELLALRSLLDSL